MPPQDPISAKWFEENLKPHEAMLRAWLRSQFSSEFDVDDIIQEAFVKVLHKHEEGEVISPKAYLFVVARNQALMRARRKVVAKEKAFTDFVETIEDTEADVLEEVSRHQELDMLTKAIQSLPTRCRQIITLRKIYGLSQKETAAELEIAVHTVEVQMGIGIRKIGAYFRKHNILTIR